MRKITTILLLLALPLCLSQLQAQDLPRPSQKAMVMQQVGLTDITVTYHRPLVKGRVIWGDLVPYNEMWRVGANDAVSIEFSKDVSISGKQVPAGKYALFMIPGESEWTIVINENWKQWGTGQYKKEEDVLRVNVSPVKMDHSTEAMTFLFSNVEAGSVSLDLVWEKLKVSLPIHIDVQAQSMASIEEAIELHEKEKKNWRIYSNAARYVLDNDGDLNKALSWINTSIETEGTWYNYWVKAQILKKQGKNKEAVATAKMSKELGDKEGERFFYKDRVEEAIANWGKAN